MKRFLFPILVLAFSSPLSAQDQEERTARVTSISKLSATTSGDRGTFSVPSVETLNRNQFSFGVGWNNFDRTPQDLDINSVPVFFSYGLTGRITVTATRSSPASTVFNDGRTTWAESAYRESSRFQRLMRIKAWEPERLTADWT